MLFENPFFSLTKVIFKFFFNLLTPPGSPHPQTFIPQPPKPGVHAALWGRISIAAEIIIQWLVDVGVYIYICTVLLTAENLHCFNFVSEAVEFCNIGSYFIRQG